MIDKRYPEAFAEGLVIKVEVSGPPPRDPETAYRSIDPSVLALRPKKQIFEAAKEEPLPDVRLARYSEKALNTIRALPEDDAIVFFTPTIIPEGHVEAYKHKPNTDPFQRMGKDMTKHHPSIHHMPYVVGVGFEDAHRQLVNKGRAVIVMVCEPHDQRRVQMLENQMMFAQRALKLGQGRGSEVRPQHLVLLQCCSEALRPLVPASFANVVQSDTFNHEVAKHIIDVIFTGSP